MAKKSDIIQINARKLNQHQMCLIFDVNRSTINDWVKAGMPYTPDETTSDKHKIYDLVECIKWRTNMLKGKSKVEGSERDDLEIKRLKEQVRKIELENINKEKKTIPRSRFEEIQQIQASELLRFWTDGYKRNAQEMMKELELSGTMLQKFLEVQDRFIKEGIKKFVEGGVDIE